VSLILEIISPPAANRGVTSRQIFQGEGGSIGREKDNSWVLPHPKVSGHHAVISYRHAVYYIEDTSRNGVCLNRPTNRLVRGQPQALTSGDRILIDPYEIRVSITQDQSDAAGPFDSSNPFETDDPFAPRAMPLMELESGVEEAEGRTVDPIELLGLAPRPAPPRKPAHANDFERGTPLDEHYQPPAAVAAPVAAPRVDASSIPRDYDPLKDESGSIPRVSWPDPALEERPARHAEADQPAPLPVAPAQPLRATPYPQPPTDAPAAAAGDSAYTIDLATVLEGAGLDPSLVTPELARSFGQILRVVVSGVIDVMQSRQQIKDEFRMRVTRVRRTENNPLKLSVDVDDALHNLLAKHNPAFLTPVAAFEDAFVDLRNHQIAMLAGMRAAFESMLAEFDPDRLQKEFDRQPKGLVPARKLLYWDLYRQKGQDLLKDREGSFRRLFGEAFARAYDEQLKQLKP